MEERIRELEEQVELMSKHIVEIVKIQGNLIKQLKECSETGDKLSTIAQYHDLILKELVADKIDV